MRCRFRHQIKTIKNAFFQLDNDPFNNLLCNQRLVKLIELSGNYRDKTFTPLITLNTFLWQTLSDNGGCKEAVARVFSERLQQ